MTYLVANRKPFRFFLEYLPAMPRDTAHMSPNTNFVGQTYVGTHDVGSDTLRSLYPPKHSRGPVSSGRFQTRQCRVGEMLDLS